MERTVEVDGSVIGEVVYSTSNGGEFFAYCMGQYLGNFEEQGAASNVIERSYLNNMNESNQ